MGSDSSVVARGLPPPQHLLRRFLHCTGKHAQEVQGGKCPEVAAAVHPCSYPINHSIHWGDTGQPRCASGVSAAFLTVVGRSRAVRALITWDAVVSWARGVGQ